MVLLVGASLAGWVFYLNTKLDDIPRFDADLDREGRPTRVSGEALNILMVGVDDGRGADLRQMLESGDWEPGSFRSDTVMVLHLDADREGAQIVSIPRDSYVPVPGLGRTKINAAFSAGGPSLLAETVEDLTGTFVDHITVVDWDGLVGIVDAIGGVEVQVPATVTDSKTGRTWQEGRQELDGEDALAYARQRYGLPGGDFDRVQRQQNLLRAMLAKTASAGVLGNPVRVTDLVGNLGQLLVVDDDLTAGAMRSLALSSRGLRVDDVRFATVPYTGTPTIDGAERGDVGPRQGARDVHVDQERPVRRLAGAERGRPAPGPATGRLTPSASGSNPQERPSLGGQSSRVAATAPPERRPARPAECCSQPAPRG